MRRTFATILAVLTLALSCWGQESGPAAAAASQAASAPATQAVAATQSVAATQAVPTGPSIALAEIVAQSESSLASVRAAAGQMTDDPVVANVEDELPQLTRDIDARLQDPAKNLSSAASLDDLRTIEAAWTSLADTTAGWKRDLTHRVAALDTAISGLSDQSTTWQNTQALAAARHVPPELTARIDATLKAINDARGAAEAARAKVLRLQALVAAQDARIADELAAIGRAREEQLAHLLVQDSPPVWSSHVQSAAAGTQPQMVMTSQFSALRVYAERQAPRLVVHGLILLLLMGAFAWARKSFDTWATEEPTLSPAKPVFASPVATAIIVSIFLSIWLHPQAPRLFWTITGAITILPAALLIQRLTERHLHQILYGLIVFYFVDQMRSLIAGLNVWPRYLLLAETLGAVGFLVHFLFFSKPAPAPAVPAPEGLTAAAPSVASLPKASRSARRRQWGLRLLFRLALLAAVAASLANILGFFSLATFIAHGLFRASYIGLIFYAGIAVLDGLVIVLLHVQPVHRLAAIKNHATLIRARARRVIGFGFLLLWLHVVLAILNLRTPVYNTLTYLFTTPFGLGPLTLGDIAKGVVTVWASFAISRFIRFLLQEDVYPHVRLPRGLGSAFSSLIHYAILLFAFITALAFLGFPLSQLTILTGAFGVGLGFGLQTIINNFFSGLIVLFERPVQVGDVIEMDAMVGTISRIGIRASIIRTPSGSDIIMPNSRLVAEKVINWTLTDRCRGFEIPLTIDGTADQQKVVSLLEATARKVRHIAANPDPVAQFTGFSGPNLQFVLRAWTDNVEEWLQVRSDLGLAVTAALAAEKVSLK